MMPDKTLNVPVVILFFNRPDLVQKVMAAVRQASPSRLFLIADGPRPDHPQDAGLCADARAIVESCIDWKCQVERNYADQNLGLPYRVAGGLDWVFSQVDQAIILEDDCVPDSSFFPYCAELLERYQNDSRVMVISGDNFQYGRQRTSYSYYFSRYNHCWGWATWQRAWRYYDDHMEQWPAIRDSGWLFDILDHDRRAVAYWRRIFQAVYEGRIHSWAYRWTLACWIESGLTALPRCNLVSNIGFGGDATHTHRRSRSSVIPTQSLEFPLRHPSYMIRDSRADRFTQSNHFGTGLSKTTKRQLIGLLSRFGFHY